MVPGPPSTRLGAERSAVRRYSSRCTSRKLGLARCSCIATGLATALLLGAPSNGLRAQETRYVTDAFKLEARRGPSTAHKIVKILGSGTPVTVLGERDGYSRIRLEDGTVAYMLSRYLTAEPSARSRLEQAMAELAQVRAATAALEAELASSQAAAQSTAENHDRLREERDRLANELSEIKRTASSAIEIRQRNQRLAGQVNELQRELEDTQALNRSLSDSTRQSWFIAGGGVLFAGMLMGLIIPKIRWQRRRGWSEL